MAYYVNFPLLFQPVNTLDKFGYNIPVGVFIDQHGGEYIRKSLQEEDYEVFREYSSRQEITTETLKWYMDFPSLTDDEIKMTWNEDDGEYPGIWPGYCQLMARMRALRAAMALRPSSGKADRLPKELIEAVRSLKGWEQIRRRRTV